MHNPANVLGLFPPPSLSDCENAIARALLRIRSNGVCIDALADKLGAALAPSKTPATARPCCASIAWRGWLTISPNNSPSLK